MKAEEEPPHAALPPDRQNSGSLHGKGWFNPNNTWRTLVIELIKLSLTEKRSQCNL